MKESQRTAVVWAALGKVAAKEARRDELTAGGSHVLHLSVAGHVDDEPVAQIVRGVLCVGHDALKASSTGPAAAGVVACILAKLNAVTREQICRTLPEEYAAAGKLPEVDASLSAAAESLLTRLRTKDQVTQRGAVSCSYQLGASTAGPGGGA
jgi:hypothetical protein